MRRLLERMAASHRTALDVSRAMWMRPEVSVEMLTRQGAALLRWAELQRLGGRAA